VHAFVIAVCDRLQGKVMKRFNVSCSLWVVFGVCASIGAANAGSYVVDKLRSPASTTDADEIFANGFDPLSQTISFTSIAPASAQFAGSTYDATATATSALPVNLSIDASAQTVCALSGSTVSFQGVGTCVIDADQAGDSNYLPAPQVQQSFAVGKADQTIAFSSTPSGSEVVAGTAYDVAANATSALTVALSIDASAASVCSIVGTSISFQASGTCVIDASQGGDANWNAAPDVQQSFSVGPGSQTITFSSTAPAAANIGSAAYAVSATATSGLAVTFSIDATASGICSLSGTDVTFQNGGTCVIDADQAGDGNWNSAPEAQQSFTVSNCLTLNVGQVVLDVMPTGANFCITNGAGGNAEFTYMPINEDTADLSGFSLTASNIVAVSGPPSPIPDAAPADETQANDAQTATTSASLPSNPKIDASMLVQPQVLPSGTYTVGQLLDINTTIGSDCNAALDIRKGRVEAITVPHSAGQQLLYAVQEVTFNGGTSTWDPAIVGGFGTQDFQNIIDAFVTPPAAPPNQSTPGGTGTLGGLLKTGAMDIFTNNFGAPTDADNNGGVIVFFTRKMNELSPPASSQVVTASFQLHDLLAPASCATSNAGEILYMLMPDPTGSVNSNVRTLSFVYGNAGTTLVHHFAHMDEAARRLYFNAAAPLEETWLDEALAWEAQELVFFSASQGLVPRQNIIVTNLTTGPFASTRVADYNTYENPIYGSMRSYFFQNGSANSNARVGPVRTSDLPNNLAPIEHDKHWLSFAITSQFLRYALDRNASGDAGLINALVNSNLTGMANMQAVFGFNMIDWARDFDVAIYTDDAGIAGIVSPYTTPSWSYRSLYTALNGSYQLTVDPLSDSVALGPFVLRYGGGTRYARFGVAPGATANVVLTNGGVSPTSAITTALVRTK
jgi:hypothetical protein